MDNLLFSFGVVMPLFLTMMIGFGMKQFKLADSHFFSVANNVCFKVLLPLMIFNNLYTCNIEEIFDIKLIIFCIVAVISLTVVCLLIVPIFVKDNSKRGVMVQGMFRSNYLLYGVPLITALSQDEGVALLSMLLVIIIPIFNVLAVIVLALFQTEGSSRLSAKKIFINILKNPLIISSAIAIIVFLLQIQLPSFLEKTISSVAATATPLSLIVLGGEFSFKKINSTLKYTVITLFVRLIAAPAVMLFIAIQLGFSGGALCVILTLFACPVAVSSYVMAKNSGGDGDLAVNLVVFSTLFSSVTIFFIVLVLRSLGYI